MPEINKKNTNTGLFVLNIFMALVSLALLIKVLMRGNNVALFNSKGLIAQEQQGLIIYSAAILLAIAVPVVLFLYFIAWKYRESNTKAVYNPSERHGKWFVFSAWGVPTVVMLVMVYIMLPATHRLEPRKPIASNAKPLTIQVVSMRWKWLFLYPEQKIATVNFVQIPLNTPIRFELTADEAPMSSFWIPNLGGQLYSMTGHVNPLNLIANTPGDYPGNSAEINGPGFAGMKFTARATNTEDFESWVENIQQSSEVLDTAAYQKIVKPSENNPTAFYSAYDTSLYDKVVMKYMGPSKNHKDHE